MVSTKEKLYFFAIIIIHSIHAEVCSLMWKVQTNKRLMIN